MNKHAAFGLSAVLALASLASAQSLSVPRDLNIGEEVSIGYHNPARAGQTIVIVVAETLPGLNVVELLVHLDQDGRGEVSYTVPDALAVTFNAPDCRQVSRVL